MVLVETLQTQSDGASCVFDFGGEVVIVCKLEEGLMGGCAWYLFCCKVGVWHNGV